MCKWSRRTMAGIPHWLIIGCGIARHSINDSRNLFTDCEYFGTSIDVMKAYGSQTRKIGQQLVQFFFIWGVDGFFNESLSARFSKVWNKKIKKIKLTYKKVQTKHSRQIPTKHSFIKHFVQQRKKVTFHATCYKSGLQKP